MNYSGITPSPQFYSNPYQPQTTSRINWVQGIEGAKAFQLLPNSNVVLLDSEADKFYIKSCDNVGMCSLRTFNYSEEQSKPPADYITRAEFTEAINKIVADRGDRDEQTISRNKQSNSSKQP